MAIGAGDLHVKSAALMSHSLKASGRSDSGIGVMGNLHLSHTERDFHRKMRRMLGERLLGPYPLELTVKDGHTGKTKKIFDVMAPYEVLHMLSGYPEQFRLAFFGNYDLGTLEAYWDIVRLGWESCPVFTDPALWQMRDKIFPVFWHSDGGNIYSNQSYTTYHWSTPFTHDVDPRDAKLYMLTIDEAILLPETEMEIAEFINWNHKVMRSGVLPTYNHASTKMTGERLRVAGGELARGYRAAFSAWTGDLKEEVRVHRLHRNYMCHFFCKKCLGCRHLQDGNAYNFGSEAQWYSMLVSHRLLLRLVCGLSWV